ncbi:hypothetical protein INR49_011637 [Caranx melampygus]|nr:hypothetical protein INR49_011637 [Caranx melampygus]
MSCSVSPTSDLLSPCDARLWCRVSRREETIQSTAWWAGSTSRGVTASSCWRRDVRRSCTRSLWTPGTSRSLTTVKPPWRARGSLHEGDSYVVRWTFRVGAAETTDSPQNTAFFLWRGRHSSVSGRDTAAFLSIGMKNQEESQVVVPQGQEPPCFLQLFQGGLVVHQGRREEASTRTAAWRLFCVRGSSQRRPLCWRWTAVCRSALQGLCRAAEQPAGGALPVDRGKAQAATRSQQESGGAAHADVSLTPDTSL